MKIFDDFEGVKCKDKNEALEFTIEKLKKLYAENGIKDILVIVRTNDDTPGPTGLPHNVFEYLSVDTEYEATVFNRMVSDMLFDRLKNIAIKEFVESIKKERESDGTNNT